MKRILYCVGIIIVCQLAGFALCEDSPPSSPEEIIRKAIQVRGGEKALARHLNRRTRAKGFMFIGDKKAPTKVSHLYSHPDHTKLIGEVSLPSGGLCTTINVFNGKTFWTKRNGITMEGNAMDLQEARMAAHMAYVETLFPLLNKDFFKLARLPKTKINGKDTLGVRVYSKDFGYIGLYFDEQTYLPVKTESRSEAASRKGLLYEVYKDEYREVNGVIHATKMVTLINGKKRLEAELVDIEPLEKVEDSEFSKP